MLVCTLPQTLLLSGFGQESPKLLQFLINTLLSICFYLTRENCNNNKSVHNLCDVSVDFLLSFSFSLAVAEEKTESIYRITEVKRAVITVIIELKVNQMNF